MAAELKNQGLSHVQMKLDQGILHCTGGVEEKYCENWKSLLAEWPKKYMSIARIDDQTLLVAAENKPEQPAPAERHVTAASAVLPGTIIAVRTHPVSSFATADGETFFAGAVLKSGYTVDTIESAGVWVRDTAKRNGRQWIGLGRDTFSAAPEDKQEARLSR